MEDETEKVKKWTVVGVYCEFEASDIAEMLQTTPELNEVKLLHDFAKRRTTHLTTSQYLSRGWCLYAKCPIEK